ncbi:MAG TPA: ferredoxin reductase family protein [Streptosporangiaceae bacterium]|jgi:predicted ferric reductase|nr:ferredoxin reductase family protein [Streptosporangiaceae bacterium]
MNSVPAAPPRPGLVQATLAVAGLGLGASTALALTTETGSEFSAPGGAVTFAGSLTGLVGTYLALMMVLLVSRIPFVERVLGHDGLLRWHRRLAPWPISLLMAHAVFITVGYAQAARSGLWHQVGVLLGQYPDVAIATAGLGLMGLAGTISLRAVRRRLRRETWWSVHLVMYLALALSFAHVIALGPAFVGHPLTQVVWWVVWLATAGLVLAYRIGLPVARTLRHRLRVVEVRPEGPGVVSVICAGRRLDKLAVSGGQFFCWRFLAPGLWWQAHPYSLSALPRPPYLRLTVKGLGDQSASMARLRPGTRVVVEGPYGTFTRDAQQRRTAALIAGGIGVTALRALLEDLPDGSGPVVILRATHPQDLVLAAEVRELTRLKQGSYHEITGRRDEVSISAQALRRLVPDLDRRDVFVCGPEGFVASVTDLARRLGVPGEAIHHEAFAL